jgi:hypothetical protein
MKNLQWGSGRVTPKAAATGNKAAHNAVALHQHLQRERSLASSVAREAYLRSLMGLPEKPQPDSEGAGS